MLLVQLLGFVDAALAQAWYPQAPPSPIREVSSTGWESDEQEVPETLFAPAEDNKSDQRSSGPKQDSTKPSANDPTVPAPSRRLAPAPACGLETTTSPLVDLQILEKELRFERIRNQIRDLIQAQRQAETAGHRPTAKQPADGSPIPSHQPPDPMPAATAAPQAELESSPSAQERQNSSTTDDANSAEPQSPPDNAAADSAAKDSSAGSPNSEPAPAIPEASEPPLVAPTVVPVDQPIDRLGLADSLYAAGELALAFDAYSQVDRSQLGPVDFYWIDYQLAACHRRLGRREEAAQLYRSLAAEPAAGWLAELSRWWLDRMHERALLKAQSDQFAQILKDLSAQIDGMKDD